MTVLAHADAVKPGERVAPCPAGPGARCAICGAEVPQPEPTPLELIPLGARPSWPARLAVMTQAWVTIDARETRDAELLAVAEWHMVRARRRFREALWADEARAA